MVGLSEPKSTTLKLWSTHTINQFLHPTVPPVHLQQTEPLLTLLNLLITPMACLFPVDFSKLYLLPQKGVSHGINLYSKLLLLQWNFKAILLYQKGVSHGINLYNKLLFLQWNFKAILRYQRNNHIGQLHGSGNYQVGPGRQLDSLVLDGYVAVLTMNLLSFTCSFMSIALKQHDPINNFDACSSFYCT
jgi:hypothetical protein